MILPSLPPLVLGPQAYPLSGAIYIGPRNPNAMAHVYSKSTLPGEPSLQPQERAFSEYETITVDWEVAHSVNRFPCEHETPSSIPNHI